MDAFQLWIYEHPECTREERSARFVDLWRRFGPWIDWSGYEEQLGSYWQRIPHLFTHPLYMVDYAIAQVGALQMWRNARRDHGAAVEAYRRALALGGSRPLPELFEAAGLRFAMDEETLGELVPDLMERISA